MCENVYVCVYWVRVCMSMWVLSASVYVCMYIGACVQVYVSEYVCVYVYVCVLSASVWECVRYVFGISNTIIRIRVRYFVCVIVCADLCADLCAVFCVRYCVRICVRFLCACVVFSVHIFCIKYTSCSVYLLNPREPFLIIILHRYYAIGH